MSATFPITPSTRSIDLAATAGQTAFTFPFPALATSDIMVRLKPAGSSAFGPALTEGVDYTAVLALGGLTAAITFAAGRAAGDVVRLRGARIPARTSGLAPDGARLRPALELELDQATLVLQELRRDLDETVALYMDVLRPHATGTLAQRQAYDAAVPPFLYLQTDHASGSPVVYVKNAGAGSWAGPLIMRGPAGPAGPVVLLDSRTIGSAVPSIVFALPAGYVSFSMKVDRLKKNDSSSLFLQVSTDGGLAWIAANYAYSWVYALHSGGPPASVTQATTGPNGLLVLSGPRTISTIPTQVRLEITPPAPGSTDDSTQISGSSTYQIIDGSLLMATIGGAVVADPPTHVRLTPLSGLITDAVVRLYGNT